LNNNRVTFYCLFNNKNESKNSTLQHYTMYNGRNCIQDVQQQPSELPDEITAG